MCLIAKVHNGKIKLGKVIDLKIRKQYNVK